MRWPPTCAEETKGFWRVVASLTVHRGAGLEEGPGSSLKRPELPWKRGRELALAVERRPVKFVPRDYWCSAALQNGTQTWPSNFGSQRQCTLLMNPSWCCLEAALSVCPWPGSPRAVRLVSSCLLVIVFASTMTNTEDTRALPRRNCQTSFKKFFSITVDIQY